jgi:flavin reductase (DIM6/NTAB) family NADH-FMN oxidoreductase RutF
VANPLTDAELPDAELTRGFLDVMAEVCTPVTVVTTALEGVPHGTTVSAFASLSLRPPMVVIALDRGGELLAKVSVTGRFGVNVLGATQDALALRFAGKGEGKFTGVEWEDEGGLPRLADAIGWLSCRAGSFLEGGDHVLVPGVVEAASALPAAPLAYHRRVFGTHSRYVSMP